MALWQKQFRPHYTPDSTRPVPRQKPRPSTPTHLPEWMKALELLCSPKANHQLPVRLEMIGESVSDRGQPMAIYACPSCNWREGWVVDRRRGKPFRLWAGQGR